MKKTLIKTSLIFVILIGIILFFSMRLMSNNGNRSISDPIVIADEAVIENVEISGGEIGILVKSGAKAFIKNVHLHDNKKGVFVEKGARVKIINSVIEKNKEEGVDIREFAKVFVINNVIQHNGESGIEMESEEVRAFIVKNKIIKNESKGIAVQYRQGEGGRAYIWANEIKDNEEYDLFCSNTTGRERTPKLFYCKFISFYGDIESVKGCKWTQCKK